MNTHVVIMAGGIGSRLWPISTPEMPKQFIDVLGVGKSLIQLTVDRFLPVCDKANFWVVTSAKYVDIVKAQLHDIPEDQILAEPVARNTAPCIAYACWKISKKYPDANIVVTPADALVLKTEKFADVISKALAETDGSSKIVTVGINPTRPETGYGYICSTSTEQDRVVKVEEFKEKPNLETAKKYVAAGNYFWNAGIFVWNVNTITSQLREHAPQIAGVMDKLSESFYTENEPAALAELFPTCDKISIDYAVMEKSKDIYVVASDLGWSDLGSWGSIKTHIPADAQANLDEARERLM
ncbi:MAG: mannose-1-phosphate guanylyltransferase, partial [Bacteroidales bacterium]|nr:mannose-1-phosphate guanylyltransferase [Bacteroidales bacterium]